MKENEGPLISVVIPVYNVENYVRKTLDSVFAQTYKNIEVICVNDGSTDNSLAVLQDYAKTHRITIIDQQNGGLSHARNEGFKLVKGEWVSFLDSDDYIAPDLYEKYVKAISPDIDLLCCWIQCVQEEKSSEPIPWFDHYSKILSTTCAGIKPCNTHYAREAKDQVGNKLYRSSIIRDNAIDFPKGLFSQDTAFHWKYIAFCRNIYFVPSKDFFYLLRSNTITWNMYKRRDRAGHTIAVAKDICYFYKDKGLVQKHQDRLSDLFRVLFSLELQRSEPENYDSLFKQASEIIDRTGFSSLTYYLKAIKEENIDKLRKGPVWKRVLRAVKKLFSR